MLLEILKQMAILVLDHINKYTQKIFKSLKICYPRFLRRRGTHARFFIIFIGAIVVLYIFPGGGDLPSSQRVPSRAIKNFRRDRRLTPAQPTARRKLRANHREMTTPAETTKSPSKIDFSSPPSIQSRVENMFFVVKMRFFCQNF